MAISKRLRFEILRRDNHTCRYCGASAPDVVLRVDHVLPEALGGRTEPENLVTACDACNSGKSSIAPDAALVADIKRDALRWARAMEAALTIHRADREAREAYVGYFTALWNDWTVGPDKEHIPLDPDWHSGVEKFYAAGLDADDLAYAVRRAMENKKVTPDNTYRYFCGIGWSILRELRDVAADIVMADLADEID